MSVFKISERDTDIPQGKWCMQPYANGDRDYICRYLKDEDCRKYSKSLKSRITDGVKGYWHQPNVFIYRCEECKEAT